MGSGAAEAALPVLLAQLSVQKDLGLCLDNENKNKTWQVFEHENIMKENNGVLMNFLERKRYG